MLLLQSEFLILVWTTSKQLFKMLLATEHLKVHLKFWDGTDENGNLLPNGVYFYSVEIDDNDPIFGKIIYMQ